jgi:hypothetical protein
MREHCFRMRELADMTRHEIVGPLLALLFEQNADIIFYVAPKRPVRSDPLQKRY